MKTTFKKGVPRAAVQLSGKVLYSMCKALSSSHSTIETKQTKMKGYQAKSLGSTKFQREHALRTTELQQQSLCGWIQ